MDKVTKYNLIIWVVLNLYPGFTHNLEAMESILAAMIIISLKRRKENERQAMYVGAVNTED